jgi:hypothetical protein
MQLRNILNTVGRWYYSTPERALERAYRAALKIKEIEDRHFNGQMVSAQFSEYGDSITDYFKSEVSGYLQTINVGLAEFKVSRFFWNLIDVSLNRPEERERAIALLEKLKFIDAVTSKYKTNAIDINPQLDNANTNLTTNVNNGSVLPKKTLSNPNSSLVPRKDIRSQFYLNGDANDPKTQATKVSEKTGVLPRSFLNTLNRIKQEIDPQSGETEEEVIKKYRNSRYKTAISIQFILLLIIVPLLTHQLTKITFINPLANRYIENNPQIVFINRNLEEEGFEELKHFQEMLEFKNQIGLTAFSAEEIEERVKEKAIEISEEFRGQGANAIANIFADLCSLAAFTIVIVTNRQKIEVLKSFLDEAIYGLSDSAKAFLIILFTDIFVGFHSPHGWEVILESIARHFGLPENRDFDFLFIATFPVILDTVFKYWIFRYLNRVSPSAVATYRNMNE